MKQRTGESLMSLVAGILAMICMMLLVQEAGATPPNKKPPKMPEPPKQVQEQNQGQHQGQQQDQSQTLTGTQETTATGGSATSDSIADAAGGSSDNAVAISNVYMSRAFAQDFPITSGCFAGVNAGHDETTGSKSTGSFLGFTYLNKSCHLQGLAAQERDVMIVARLKCGDRKYRNAVAFDAKDHGQKKRERCIAVSTQSMIGAIEDERRRVELLEDELRQANARTEAARDAYELSEAHRNVCRDSLDRCEDKAYGSK